jgi:DivIVA domain-containing protein
MGDQTTAEAAIARIRDAKFRTTRLGGYDDREVDDFLDEMVAQLPASPRRDDSAGSVTAGGRDMALAPSA